MEIETFPNEGPLWPCGCLLGDLACRCGADEEAPAEHWDHDIHGVMVMVAPDDSMSIDPDCDCPPSCAGCEQEGVDRS